MSRKNLISDDKKIEKSNFYQNKKLFKVDKIHVDKILISKKEPFGTNKSFEYFTGYSDNGEIKPLCIKFPQIIDYAKHFESNKTMSLKVIDNKLLKKYAKKQTKISVLVGKKFDSKPDYDDRDNWIETSIKIFDGKVNTKFQGQKLPK